MTNTATGLVALGEHDNPQVTLEVKGHKYHISGDPAIDPEEALISASTVSGYADKVNDGLLWWAAYAAMDHNSANGFKQLNEVAKTIGTETHESISRYIATDGADRSDSWLFGIWYSKLMEKMSVSDWVATELMVYHRELKYAGTVDAIGIVDDKVVLFDWKTTEALNRRGQKKSNNRQAHATQLGGYILALREMFKTHPIRHGDRVIRDIDEARVCYIYRDERDVKERFEEKIVDIDKATKAFEACLGLVSLVEQSGGLYKKPESGGQNAKGNSAKP